MNNRKLKPPNSRRPASHEPHIEIVKKVSRITGFTKENVGMVIDEYLASLKELLLERKSVKLRSVGTISPIVTPPRNAINMGGTAGTTYEKIVTDPVWKLRFVTEKALSKEVKEIMVTKKDLDNIYYKSK